MTTLTLLLIKHFKKEYKSKKALPYFCFLRQTDDKYKASL